MIVDATAKRSDSEFKGVNKGTWDAGTDAKRQYALAPTDHDLIYGFALEPAASGASELIRCRAIRGNGYTDDFQSDFPHDLMPSFTQPLELLRLCSDAWRPEVIPTARTGLGLSLALSVPLALGSAAIAHAEEAAWSRLTALSNPLHVSHAFVGPIDHSALPRSLGDKIVLELQLLQDGWDGPESVAPSPALIEDVKSFFSSVDVNAHSRPDVQVDEDGTVAMFWRAEPRRLFSANFSGHGVVVMSYVSQVANERFADRVDVKDKAALLRALTKSKMSWAVSRRA